MFKEIQAKLEAERKLHQEALDAIRGYDPADDPQINARDMSANFIQGKIAVMSRDIDAYRVAQLCLDNMQPETTPAGPASPVRATFPNLGMNDG